MPNQPNQSNDDFPAGLSQPARRALAGAGIHYLRELTGFSEADLKKLHGMGPKGINLLRETLAQQGLAFAGESKEI